MVEYNQKLMKRDHEDSIVQSTNEKIPENDNEQMRVFSIIIITEGRLEVR